MKNLALSLLLKSSIIAMPALAGPSHRSDKVITGIIVGATAAALIAALANAEEVQVYSKPPKHHKPPKPRYAPHYAPRYKERHWKREHWHGKNNRRNPSHQQGRHFEERRRYWRH
jgi:hypothetical protein